MKVEGCVGLAGLVKYWWFMHPKMITHSRSSRESNSRPLSRKSDTLTRIQSHYSTGNIVVHSLLFNFAAYLQIEKFGKILKYSRINARATILRKTLFSSVYSVIIHVENLTKGKVTN